MPMNALTTTPDENPYDELSQWQNHLNWTAKQGRILTDSGNAIRYYTKKNGFPFSLHELPHHYLEQGASRSMFRKWAKERNALLSEEKINRKTPPVLTLPHGIKATALQVSPIIGAWDRPLFAGKWEHSTNKEEIVYNIQTGTLFVDLRIPRSKPIRRWEKLRQAVNNPRQANPRQALESMSEQELRLYARQHVFGGFSVLTVEQNKAERPLCTRHHCIDWNHIRGKPRTRPNKWYIESKNNSSCPSNVWKEWSYSTDENAQSYYFETWQRIEGDENGEGLRLAMRKKNNGQDDDTDGILVVVGDHFNYILGRQLSGHEKAYPDATNLVELVDSAIENGDRESAISYLSLDGGHGTISSGWTIDCSIQSWNHGMRVFDRIGGGKVKVVDNGADFFSWDVIMGDTSWQIYECSIGSAAELEKVLTEKKCNPHSRL
mmetsp:Transcript_17436/g.37667  ORF Transcript_17436/g.37667 Transcript_17436/m.37667 type:complete len:434 (-) Transcript_17436:2550-3851(-)